MELIAPSTSTIQARNILGALATGNGSLLAQELRRVKQADLSEYDAFELERMELLSEVARELEHVGSDGAVCEMLLKHLAAPKPARSNVAAMPWVAGSQSKLSGALLQ